MDDAELSRNKDAVRAIPRVRQQDWAKLNELPLGLFLPAGPFQVRKCDRWLQQERTIVYFRPRYLGRDCSNRPGLHIRDQEPPPRNVVAEIGCGLESFGQQHGLLARPRDDEHLAVLPVTDVEPAVRVEDESIGAAEA